MGYKEKSLGLIDQLTTMQSVQIMWFPVVSYLSATLKVFFFESPNVWEA